MITTDRKATETQGKATPRVSGGYGAIETDNRTTSDVVEHGIANRANYGNNVSDEGQVRRFAALERCRIDYYGTKTEDGTRGRGEREHGRRKARLARRL